MFGLSPVAALAISAHVERAVADYRRRTDVTTAEPDVADLEEIAAHERARIEEWTA